MLIIFQFDDIIDVFLSTSQNFVFFQKKYVFEFFEFRRHFFRDVVWILDESSYSAYWAFFDKLIWLNKNRIKKLMFLHFICEFFCWSYLKSILDEVITSNHNCIIQFDFFSSVLTISWSCRTCHFCSLHKKLCWRCAFIVNYFLVEYTHCKHHNSVRICLLHTSKWKDYC